MKKLVAAFVLAVVAGTAIAATVTHLVSKNDDGRGIGGSSVTFHLDGVGYIITDEATLERIDEATKAHMELEMRQAKLGVLQARIGARQRDASGAQRDRLAKEQLALAEAQAELAKATEEAKKQMEEELEKIFRNAVRTGVARRR